MALKFNPFTGTLDIVTLPGTGDVVGPTGATDKAIARYDGTTGKLIQNSKTLVQDGGMIEAQGFLSKRAITDAVKINPGEAWIAPSIELELGGSIELEPDGEIIVV